MPQQKESQGLRTQKEANKKTIAVLGRERIDHQWALEKTKYIRPEFGEEETSEILPSSLDQTLQRSRKLTLVRILALCQLLLVFPGSHMQDLLKQWGDPAGPICILRNCGGGKVIFPLPFWVLGWDSFFSRAPYKWISLSRLKVLHCGPLYFKIIFGKINLFVPP